MDGLKQLEDESVHCVVTSPPYFGLRDYGVEGQIGLETTPDVYVAKLVEVFREVRRDVATAPFPEAHFATFPPALIEPCIKAGCPKGGTVLDPFGGSGATGLVADRLKRNAVLIELNPEYAAMAERRIKNDCPMFAEVG